MITTSATNTFPVAGPAGFDATPCEIHALSIGRALTGIAAPR